MIIQIYEVQTPFEAEKLIEDALELEKCGCFLFLILYLLILHLFFLLK